MSSDVNSELQLGSQGHTVPDQVTAFHRATNRIPVGEEDERDGQRSNPDGNYKMSGFSVPQREKQAV